MLKMAPQAIADELASSFPDIDALLDVTDEWVPEFHRQPRMARRHSPFRTDLC